MDDRAWKFEYDELSGTGRARLDGEWTDAAISTFCRHLKGTVTGYTRSCKTQAKGNAYGQIGRRWEKRRVQCHV